MLANEVFVSVYGSLSQGLYSGYISENGGKNVYIMSRRPVHDTFLGIVTAVITLTDGSEKLIVSQKSDILYEPEIRSRLSRLRSLSIAKISCLYEKSCGAVILHRDKKTNEIKILMVRNHNGRFYSFPKGHIELWEKEKETAVREIKEETNLDVEILDGFREISDYCPFGKIRKRVVFFLATAQTDDIRIQESEIDSFTWIPLNGTKSSLNYDNDTRVIEKVKKYLQEHPDVI